MKHLLVVLSIVLLFLPEMRAQDMANLVQENKTEILIKTPDKKQKKAKKEDPDIDKKHNPKTATWLALIPGAGQAYNKKYWKMPIVYAGFGVTGYLGISNGKDYRLYRDAYDYKSGINLNVSDKAKEMASKYSGENLITLRDYHRRNMELSWIIMAAWYAVQIIDASVDAHFYYYEMDENISIQVDPKWEPAFNDYACGYGNGLGTAGLSVKLNF